MQQTITSKSHNNSKASQNSQRRDAGDNDDQDDAMFNDDDDLDITEIDQALLGDKTPLTAQKTNVKDSKMKDSSSSNTEKMSTTRRYGRNFFI